MPRYEITSPDGKSWEVNAPEGATQDQVLEYAKSQWSKSQPAMKQPERAPAEDPGMLNSLLIGAGRTFDRIGKGAEQAYYGARSAMSGPDTTSLVTGGKNQWDLKADKLRRDAASDDEVYKQLQEIRPWATGIGEALPSMAIPGGGATTLAGNAGRMALAGAIPGALEYGTAGERAGRAALGGLAGASIPALAAVGRSVKSFAEPLYEAGRQTVAGRLLNQVAGDGATAAAQKLKAATSLVPGSMPTAAEVAESGGLAALQRAASQANPETYTQRAMEQASARLGALRGIAKDDAALEAAMKARDSAAGPLYDQAKKAMMDNAGALPAALERLPSEVMAKAQRLAKLAGEPLKVGQDLPAQQVASKLLDASGNPVMSTTAAQTSKYSGKALHYIKLALDDSISATGESALGNTEKRLMTGAKEQFLNAVDSGIPAYGQARQQFATLSKPVNQMELGRALLDKSRPALADFGALGQESGATYARALRDGDALAAKTTGMKSATMADVLSPDQMQAVNAIAQDLARKSNAQNLGRGVGSDTFQKIAMSNIAEQSGMPKMMGGLLNFPGISRATRWMYSDADQKMQGLLSDALLNPQQTAALMEASKRGLLADNPKTRKVLEQSLLRAGLLGAPSSYSTAD